MISVSLKIKTMYSHYKCLSLYGIDIKFCFNIFAKYFDIKVESFAVLAENINEYLKMVMKMVMFSLKLESCSSVIPKRGSPKKIPPRQIR